MTQVLVPPRPAAAEPMPLGIRVGSRREAPVVIEHTELGLRLRIAGCVNASGVGEVRAGLREAVDRGCGDLVVDMTDFELGDATGLGALVGAHRRASRAGRTLVLSNGSPALLRVLRYTRLIRVLRITETAAPRTKRAAQ